MINRGRMERALLSVLVAAIALGASTGCVTWAEFRKLERRVIDMQRAGNTVAPDRQELADTGAEIDELRSEVQRLSGRVEVAEKQSQDAAAEARRLREELVALRQGQGATAPAVAAATPAGEAAEPAAPADEGPPSAEVVAYREAYASWRDDDHEACVDQFRSFLQTYPASPYADDSAFWMADCHYKQGDYKNAVLRFDDVVRNYPTGNRAPDALYRQGESLLKLGPSYHEAAKRAFQRVVTEYPDSARAAQAKEQLRGIDAG